MSVTEALEGLRSMQQDFYDGIASKEDLRWALDQLAAARRRTAPKSFEHNPPVKLT